MMPHSVTSWGGVAFGWEHLFEFHLSIDRAFASFFNGLRCPYGCVQTGADQAENNQPLHNTVADGGGHFSLVHTQQPTGLTGQRNTERGPYGTVR